MCTEIRAGQTADVAVFERQKAKREDDVFLVGKVLPVHAYLLNRQNIMRRAFSLTNVY